jgi:hypothetical protein
VLAEEALFEEIEEIIGQDAVSIQVCP